MNVSFLDMRVVENRLLLLLKKPEGKVVSSTSEVLSRQILNVLNYGDGDGDAIGEDSWMGSQWYRSSTFPTVVHRFTTQSLSLVVQVLVDFLEANQIAPGSPLVIFPSPGLSQMPLGGTQLPGKDATFEEIYPFTYATSEPFYQELAMRERAGQLIKTCLLANPQKGDPKNALRWAEIEGLGIAKAQGVQAKVGQNATRQSLIDDSGDAELVWLSCHGSYNENNPFESCFYLSDGTMNLEGLISELKLKQCRLAVLSACQTARTDSQNLDESNLGLHLGLMMAGAPTVWATLWSVDDASTYLFYTYAFEALLTGESSVAALAVARKKVRETTVDDIMVRLSNLRSAYADNSDARQSIDIAKGDIRDLGNKGLQYPFDHPYHWAGHVHYGVEFTIKNSESRVATA